jgi:YVTN family beta-propeller protein
VYVSNYGDSTVSVIDCVGDTVVATIMAGRYPYHLAHNPQHDKVYVISGTGNDVVVLDGTGDSIITKVNVGASPYNVAYSERTGLAYVGVNARHLVLIDGATNEVRKTVPSGVRSEVFALNPTGGRVYAISAYSSDISVIVDSLTGIEESPKPQASSHKLVPTIIRGILFLPSSSPSLHPSSLLDVSGRKVLDLTPGANDVRGLRAGVYFIREAQAQAVTKVVVTH